MRRIARTLRSMKATEKVVDLAKLAQHVRRGDTRALNELLHKLEPGSCDVLMNVITTGGRWEVPHGRIDSIIDAYLDWREVQSPIERRDGRVFTADGTYIGEVTDSR